MLWGKTSSLRRVQRGTASLPLWKRPPSSASAAEETTSFRQLVATRIGPLSLGGGSPGFVWMIVGSHWVVFGLILLCGKFEWSLSTFLGYQLDPCFVCEWYHSLIQHHFQLLITAESALWTLHWYHWLCIHQMLYNNALQTCYMPFLVLFSPFLFHVKDDQYYVSLSY